MFAFPHLSLLFTPKQSQQSHYYTLRTVFTMRSTLIVSAFTAPALAAPRPQDTEWDQVDASPDQEIVSPPTDVTIDTIAIQPAPVHLIRARSQHHPGCWLSEPSFSHQHQVCLLGSASDSSHSNKYW
jgi:hypothetical protein